jgi:hypothetical protein
MMDSKEFLKQVTRRARKLGYRVGTNRDDLEQIDFGNKALHTGHLAKLHPDILDPEANTAELIEKVAPGRPCTHKPMREIVSQINETE